MHTHNSYHIMHISIPQYLDIIGYASISVQPGRLVCNVQGTVSQNRVKVVWSADGHTTYGCSPIWSSNLWVTTKKNLPPLKMYLGKRLKHL